MSWRWVATGWAGGQAGQAAASVMKNQMSAEAMLAREAVQNSWDAAQPLRGRPGHEFKVTFRFRELLGHSRQVLVDTLQLHAIAARADLVGYEALGLQPDSIFAKLDDPGVPIRVLEIEDRGAHGLYGHPRTTAKSPLFLALYALGVTAKGNSSGGGGSYGFGKAAFIANSSVHTVFAYSCFEPREGDPVTRRAIGFSWQKAHTLVHGNDEQGFEGRAILGQPEDPDASSSPVWPHEDATADALAMALGLSTRTPSSVNELGTSLLLLEPSVTPERLVEELERWWWPAINDGDMDLVVEDYQGAPLHPKPRTRPELRPFITAYELATRPQDARLPDNQRSVNLSTGALGLVGIKPITGAVEVVQDEYEDPEDLATSKQPQIALMRRPKMVVQYWGSFQRKRLPIRGVFIADDASNELLRRTEPPAHDDWLDAETPDVPVEASKCAKKVRTEVRAQVNAFAKEMAPTPAKERVALPMFNKFFGSFSGDGRGGPTPPPPGKVLPVSIEYVKKQAVNPADDDNLFVTAQVQLKLRPVEDAKPLKVVVKAKFAIVEDETSQGDLITVHLSPAAGAAGFAAVTEGDASAWAGTLLPGIPVQFNLQTNPYDRDLSGEITVEVAEETGK